jgi:hypothetical protein
MSGYFNSSRFVGAITGIAILVAVLLALSGVSEAARNTAGPQCTGGPLAPGTGGDIEIVGKCTTAAGLYKYRNVNVIQGGTLAFSDAMTEFWAESIIIENGGAMTAGVADDGSIVPIGTAGGRVTIHLYGKQQPGMNAVGARCATDSTETPVASHQCGIPDDLFNSNMMKTPAPTTCTKASAVNSAYKLPGDDCFYMYDSMPYDGGGNVKGYFGYKEIGLSYGGTLRLYGKKGATYVDTNTNTAVDPANTGTSWVRLNSCPNASSGVISGGRCIAGVLQPGASELTVSNPVNWSGGALGQGDKIILTTSDFLPAHSEQLEVKSVSDDGLTITLQNPTSFPHHASAFDLSSRIPSGQKLTDLTSVDTRAAVGLLTRSIRIVSGGDALQKDFPAPSTDLSKPSDFFGGHVVIRQGFTQLQIQGVEFYQLGQGGRIGHYPLHFHMARQVPPNTFVKDSSIWDSMTRWIVLHATQGVLLARNVGYLSIGHGYYLEDGTETNNQLYANLGVSARAAVGIRALDNDEKEIIKPDASNPRLVPGILASLQDHAGKPYGPDSEHTPYDSDYEHPTVFWFMNGWNDFQNNMASGAETCGMCYWMPPGGNSGGSQGMVWTGYASEQKNYIANKGTSPLLKFLGNTCSTAMTAFTDVGNTSYCVGLNSSQPAANLQYRSIPNPLLKNQKPTAERALETFFPRIDDGGNHHTTLCPNGDSADCSTVSGCSDGVPGTVATASQNCTPIVLDRFTTSFNFAETNFSAIWLRPQWNLVINSAITDVLNAGITFVSGGGYTRSDALRGLWNLARKSVFIGSAQTMVSNPYASNGGPVNPGTGILGSPNTPLKCGNPDAANNYCIPVDSAGKDLGINLLRSNWGMSQRFFNIYDGPSFEDSNSYLDITPTQLTDCNSSNIYNRCDQSAWMQRKIQGVPGIFQAEGSPPTNCYLPNAAIAWKQPNGFYYPPAFHSTNLFFNNVDIRHYVIEPLFMTGTYQTNNPAVQARYCVADPNVFNNFTDIDRQTELNDDDGSLTGLIDTISVNLDPFFKAPTEDIECRSDTEANTAGTAKTSPYDYVTAVVYPECATFDRFLPVPPNKPETPNPKSCQPAGSVWNYDGGAPAYGVLLYRQLINQGESKAPFIKMLSQATGQRSTLVPNNGIYYIDTTVDAGTQRKTATSLSVFEPNQGGDNPLKRYHVFLLFAKPTSKETFQLFIGKGLSDAFITANVIAEKGDAAKGQMSFTPLAAWPSGWGSKGKPDYDPSTGILTVTMDLGAMGGSNFPTDYTNSIPGRCQPKSMCSWNATTTKCECNIPATGSPLSYLHDECVADNSAICSWAVKDIDYPDDDVVSDPGRTKGAAYGFSFTMPGPCADGNDQNCFSTQPTQAARDALRPQPSCFPQDVASGWNKPFDPTTGTLAGDCTYNHTPPSPTFCTNP